MAKDVKILSYNEYGDLVLLVDGKRYDYEKLKPYNIDTVKRMVKNKWYGQMFLYLKKHRIKGFEDDGSEQIR